jgi:hypothetical protein
MTDEEAILIELIQSILTPELIPVYFRNQPENPMFGHCYGAAEALYRLLGGRDCGYKAQRAVDETGVSHWWIVSRSGCILDPTSAQYTDFCRTPPYDSGSAASFRTVSKRAKEIIRRVKEKAN